MENNNMKDRLIDLIHESDLSLDSVRLADHLLANGVIVLPFPIGTTYYRIVTKRGKVGNPYFKMIRKAELNWYNVENVLHDLGKTVFLTREEAEKKLKEQ